MSSTHRVSDGQLGPELLGLGCHQGALVEAPARMLWLMRPGPDQAWTTAEDEAGEALLVVASQNCDIYAGPKTEPCVEALTAKWTANTSDIYTARKGNSARLYLLRETDGKALLADARRRLHIDKRSLLSAKFSDVLHERSLGRFASWIAGRYNRPAIENELVEAIQKPIVKALASTIPDGLPLDRISELRFRATEAAPLKVDFIAMFDEGEELTPEEEADFGGWLEQTLVVENGTVREIRLSFRNPRSISLSDYLQTTRLQLDQYTPETDSEVAA